MANDLQHPVDPVTNRSRQNQSTGPALKSPLAVLLGLFGALAIWAYWPSLGGVTSAWLSNPDYTHGFFVVPISIWLLWARRDQMPKASLSPSWAALSILLLAALVRVASGRFYLPQLDAWSIPIWVAGVVWLLFGWAVLRWALPSIAFLWFATPLPGTIEILLSTPLQHLASALGGFSLRVLGQPAIAEGTTILLDDNVLDVERACSGLRMFYGIFALAVGCIAVARPARWKAVLILLAAVPVAIIANVLRIVATGLLMRYTSSETAQRFSHDLAGLVMIPVAVTLFIVFLAMIGRVARRFEMPGAVAWLTKWGLGFIVVTACAFFWGRYQGKKAISTLREAAARSESEKNWAKSIHFLSRYIRAVPDDYDAFGKLAELYRAHAVTYEDQLRAVELLRRAWKQQPEKEDYALSAVRMALQLRDHGNTISLCDELLERTTDAKTRSAATKLRAESLLAYLQSDVNRGDYSWDDVKNAFEKALTLPDYDVIHASTLADLYRNRDRSISREERDKRASALMDRVVAERAEDPLAWLARSEFRMRHNRQRKEDVAAADQDLAHALKLAEKDPGKPESIVVLLAAAVRASERTESQKAVALLESAIKAAPSDLRAYLMLAEVNRRTGTPESRAEAIRILREGLKHSKEHDLALILPLASLLAENGDLAEAEQQIAPIESLVPKIAGQQRAIIRLVLGMIRSQILSSRDGPEAAIIHLRNLLSEPDIQLAVNYAPGSLAQGYATLAQLYSMVGDMDLAADASRQAARIEPNKLEWQIQTAALTLQMGDLDAADRSYQGLVRNGLLAGDNQTGIIELEIQRQLQQSADQRDWAAAKRMVLASREAGLSPIPVGLLAAKILAASGETEKAENSILKLAEQFPEEPSVWRSLAIIRHERGNTSGALQAADRFKELKKQTADAVGLRAAILADVQRPDEAVKELSDFLATAPADQLPKAALQLSGLLNKAGRRADAIAALEQAHQKAPKNLQMIDVLATMALSDRNWTNFEKYQSWLRDAEGENGTLAKSFRLQRLLADPDSTDDRDLQQIATLSDQILRERPRWLKAHYLQGEAAIRLKKYDEAAAAFGRAWQLGARGTLLAERLIDLATRQGRLEEAQRYVAQVRDKLGSSQELFDRAMPYLASGDDNDEVLRLAQGWIDQSPTNPEARIRMGRVLLMLAESSPADKKKAYVERAKSELQQAIEFAPNDVRLLSSVVIQYAASKETRDQALQLLDDLARNSNINALERDFAVAQLYEALGQPGVAQRYLRQAAAVAQEKPDTPGAGDILARAAQFFMQRAPTLAELYARQALAHDADNRNARLVLLTLLVARTDDESSRQAMQLLNDGASKTSLDPKIAARMRAVLLSRRASPQDLEEAIRLLEPHASSSREDKLLLARLYEQSGQIAQALDLFQQLARAPDAQPGEMAEFLRFWQKQFVATASKSATTQFAAQAKEVYQRLGERPGQLVERLRWQLRELRARNPNREPTAEECRTAVDEILATPTAAQMNDDNTRFLFQYILIVLLQENCDNGAFQLALAPPERIAPPTAAIVLCHSFVAVPGSKESASNRRQAIEKLLSAFSENAGVIQAVGDCSFVAADYELAVRAYQLAQKIEPDRPMLRNNLALALAELPGRVDEAQQVLSAALSADANNLDLLDTQATLHLIDNQPEKAVAILDKILAQVPDSASPRLHLAIAYDQLHNVESARANLLAAAALGIQQHVLSPRDRKSFDELQQRYMVSEVAAIAKASNRGASNAAN